MALRYNLQINQGETWQLAIPVYRRDGTPDPAVPTATVRGQIRAAVTDSAVLHTWSTSAGNVVQASGQITLQVPATVSAAWAWRRGRYDVELVAPDGTVTRLVEGAVMVRPEVTR